MFRFFKRSKSAETAAAAPADTRALGDDPMEALILGATPTIAGPSITPISAMRCPAVAAAVNLISTSVGTLPAKIFVRGEDGGKEADRDHPAYDLVHAESNPWTAAGDLRQQLTADALLHGAGFAQAIRANGRIVELHRLAPHAVTVETDEITSEPVFKVRLPDGGERHLDWRDVIYIPAPGNVAPIVQAREAIALSLVLEQHAGRLFSKGARPSGILKFPAKLGAEVAKRIKASWRAAHSGENSGDTAVLEEGGEFQPLAFTSVDSQFEQIRRFQILEIARVFRVAPVFLQEYGRATWSNGETMGRQFLQFTLLPWLRTWEAAYARVLLSPEDRRSHTIEFVVDDLLRADTATRAEAYSKFRAAGILTANEIRAMENKPAIEGGDSLHNPFITTGGDHDNS